MGKREIAENIMDSRMLIDVQIKDLQVLRHTSWIEWAAVLVMLPVKSFWSRYCWCSWSRICSPCLTQPASSTGISCHLWMPVLAENRSSTGDLTRYIFQLG